jgi:integrase
MFDMAIPNGYFIGANPARWEAGLKEMLTPPSDLHAVEHRASLDFRKVPEFIHYQLRPFRYKRPWPLTGTDRPIVSYAIEFLILTAVRSAEVVQARWSEFDLTEMRWRVPATHKKNKNKDRSVPITRTMLAILGEMQKLRFDPSPDAYVFPSVTIKGQIRAVESIGDQTLQRVLRDYLKVEFTNHGWRSAFSDWRNANAAKYPLEWWRMQLDHWEGVPQADRAYGHDRLLEERRGMMQAYDDFVTTPPTKPKAHNVVTLEERRTA